MKLNFHENPYLLYLTVFLGFIFLSIIIAVKPSIKMQQINEPIPGSAPLSEAEQQGLDLYVSEGCLYCHTQQVRPLEMDEPYGRPSTPGDYARLKPIGFWRFTPSTLGSERTGPDLSNIGNRQPSEIWHYIHLYNPRAVVKNSIMQAYPWYFEVKVNPDSDDIVVPIPEEYAPKKGKVVPTQKAKNIVAYLLSLKQTSLPGKVAAELDSTVVNKENVSGSDGEKLYNINCSACHQQDGRGVQGVFPPLLNDPVVNDDDPTRQIEIVLFGLSGETIGGVNYTAPMPPHKDTLSDDEIAHIINYEREKWGNDKNKITQEDVAQIRKNKSGE